jgi:hypothetical protein
MKIKTSVTLFFLALTLSLRAQTEITWWTVDAGGGQSSSGGVYAVVATVGQPDAGRELAGGPYVLQGGYWAAPSSDSMAVPPQLTIRPGVLGTAIISWAPSSPGYVLQHSTSLAPSSWNNAPSGAANPVVVPVNVPARYYRLVRP